jgi:catechol 2,3-dioxygenase-like lactoylglutathione lyase family enzyme
MAIEIDRLDHLVLTVRDMDATCAFYSRVLGMERRMFGDNRTALYFGRQKLNLHDAANPVDPNVRHAAPGSSDLCFITETPMADVIAHLEAEGISIITGPGERSGATGTLNSVYIYDPDENLIEIANLLQ